MRSVIPAIALLLALPGCTPVHYRTAYVRSFLEARRDRVIVQKWDLSCGAAALATLLTYDLNTPVTEHDVAAALLKRYRNIGQVQRQLGFSLLDLKAFADGRGYDAAGYGGVALHDLVTMAPSIVPVHMNGFNHFVIFRGIRGSRVLLADPAFGNRSMHLDYFASVWRSHVAFVVKPGDGNPAPDRMAPRPSEFWATSIDSEPVSARTLALEAQATGTALADAATPPAAPSSSPPSTPAPGGTAVAAVANDPLAHVIAAGDAHGGVANPVPVGEGNK